MIQVGDLCEVIDSIEARAIGVVGWRVHVINVFAESLVFFDDEGWRRINCEVSDLNGCEYWSHTDLLRRVPPDCNERSQWRTTDIWRPVTVPA